MQSVWASSLSHGPFLVPFLLKLYRSHQELWRSCIAHWMKFHWVVVADLPACNWYPVCELVEEDWLCSFFELMQFVCALVFALTSRTYSNSFVSSLLLCLNFDLSSSLVLQIYIFDPKFVKSPSFLDRRAFHQSIWLWLATPLVHPVSQPFWHLLSSCLLP